MKQFIRNNPALYSLVLFLMMIGPALLLFPAAQSEGKAGTFIFLGLVILSNLAAAFPIKSR